MIGGYSPWLCEETAKRIKTEAAEAAMMLGRGNAPDYPTYRYEAGRIAGLERVLDILEDIKRESESL